MIAMAEKVGFGMVLFVLSSTLVLAHGGGAPAAPAKERRVLSVATPGVTAAAEGKEMRGQLIHENHVAGFDLKFKLVDAKESVDDGGSHNLLVNIERNERTAHGLSVNARIDDQHGNVASKSMMQLGDWYLAGYDLSDEKRYVITVSFTAPDGRVHRSAIHYPCASMPCRTAANGG